MKADIFQDAITLLPEDLLQPVDALRQKKKFPWQSVLAAAACLCLMIGLSFLYRPELTQDSSKTTSAENFAGNGMAGDFFKDEAEAPNAERAPISEAEDVAEPSKHASGTLKVVDMGEDYASVVDADSPLLDNFPYSIAPVTLLFHNLSETPNLKAGQKIRIYYRDEDYDAGANTIAPYRIEIVEE